MCSTDHTAAILHEFEKLRLKSLSDKEVFKVRAYDKAINGIKDLGTPIHSLEDVAKVAGIGAKIKEKIKTLIEGEDNRKPLADATIVQILGREGINIARRTVAKYREELGIASSSQRRRVF